MMNMPAVMTALEAIKEEMAKTDNPLEMLQPMAILAGYGLEQIGFPPTVLGTIKIDIDVEEAPGKMSVTVTWPMPGLLSCGCPQQIVKDEGHQEGCEDKQSLMTGLPAQAHEKGCSGPHAVGEPCSVTAYLQDYGDPDQAQSGARVGNSADHA